MRPDANPECIRRALQPDFPHWSQAFSTYKRHKPIGNRPAVLFVNVAATDGLLVCAKCGTRTEVRSGERVVERCSSCKSFETSWVREPTYDRVRVTGTCGGYSDPYTGRDFCLDLERWCECVTFTVFRFRSGFYILEFWGLYDLGVRKTAAALRAMKMPVGKSTVQNVRKFWGEAWEKGPENALAKLRTVQGPQVEHCKGAAGLTTQKMDAIFPIVGVLRT